MAVPAPRPLEGGQGISGGVVDVEDPVPANQFEQRADDILHAAQPWVAVGRLQVPVAGQNRPEAGTVDELDGVWVEDGLGIRVRFGEDLLPGTLFVPGIRGVCGDPDQRDAAPVFDCRRHRGPVPFSGRNQFFHPDAVGAVRAVEFPETRLLPDLGGADEAVPGGEGQDVDAARTVEVPAPGSPSP